MYAGNTKDVAHPLAGIASQQLSANYLQTEVPAELTALNTVSKPLLQSTMTDATSSKSHLEVLASTSSGLRYTGSSPNAPNAVVTVSVVNGLGQPFNH